MIAVFTLAALRCGCGSPEVVSIDPGSDAPGMIVAARGWCIACVEAFASLLPREAGKMRKIGVNP